MGLLSISFSLFLGESLSERGNCYIMLVVLLGMFCVVVVVVGPFDFWVYTIWLVLMKAEF